MSNNVGYLVLTRKPGESLALEIPQSDGSKMTIFVDILGSKNLIGIEAPKEVKILREELRDHPYCE